MNCWDFKKCGREVGGSNAEDMGVCPAHDERRLDGVHGGRNAGRACWAIAGTFCGGQVQGSFAEKEKNCLACDFYKLVRQDERGKGTFKMSPDIVAMLAA